MFIHIIYLTIIITLLLVIAALTIFIQYGNTKLKSFHHSLDCMQAALSEKYVKKDNLIELVNEEIDKEYANSFNSVLPITKEDIDRRNRIKEQYKYIQ